MEWVFLQATSFCHPVISVQVLRGKLSPNQWSGLLFSSFTTRLLMEGALVPSHQLSDVRNKYLLAFYISI